MSGFTSFAAAGGANQNLDNTYEFIGFGSGDGTLITAAGTANTKGSYTQLTAGGVGGITQNALRGIFLMPLLTSAAGNRYLADISFDGGTTANIPDVYLQPGTAVYGSTPGKPFPMAIAAGANIQVRVQSATASGTVRFAIVGVISNSQSPPCFSTCTALTTASTADTRATSTNIPLTDTWTEAVASTAAQYGAILAVAGSNGTALGTAQTIGVQVGTGAAAAEVAFMRWLITGNTGAPEMPRGFSPLAERVTAAGARLSVKAFGAVAGTDNIRVQLFGFS